MIDIGLVLKIIDGDLTIPESVLNSPLGPILKKAVAQKPEDRYANGTELMHAISNVSHHINLVVEPLTPSSFDNTDDMPTVVSPLADTLVSSEPEFLDFDHHD